MDRHAVGRCGQSDLWRSCGAGLTCGAVLLYLTYKLINLMVTIQDTLSQTFAALADPTRRAMIMQLSKGVANISDLAKPFEKDMSLPAITKHVKVLEKAGLITK